MLGAGQKERDRISRCAYGCRPSKREPKRSRRRWEAVGGGEGFSSSQQDGSDSQEEGFDAYASRNAKILQQVAAIMTRPKIADLPPENQRVAQAWQDAKARNPRLTQAEFSAAVFGGRKRAKAKAFGGPPESWPKRQAEADARYLRLILEGKRRPVTLVRRADRGGVVNVAVRHGDAYSSFNIRLPSGVSKLDAFRLRDSKQLRKIIREQAKAWAKRYGETVSAFTDDAPEMRGVRRARSRPLLMPA